VRGKNKDREREREWKRERERKTRKWIYDLQKCCLHEMRDRFLSVQLVNSVVCFQKNCGSPRTSFSCGFWLLLTSLPIMLCTCVLLFLFYFAYWRRRFIPKVAKCDDVFCVWMCVWCVASVW
jgi:hypothetical protein